MSGLEQDGGEPWLIKWSVGIRASVAQRSRHVSYRVGVVGGDGIGPEVIEQGLRVIEAAGIDLDTTEFDLGGAR